MRKSKGTGARASAGSRQGSTKSVRLLSGDNPQIAKGYGDGPVRDYIAAIPGWKQQVAEQLDALIVRCVPQVQKAVKWNTALYGREGDGWFVAFHVYAKYLKVTFFRGTSLTPLPPVASKTAETRYVHLGEEPLDEAQLASWLQQAAKLPGERL